METQHPDPRRSAESTIPTVLLGLAANEVCSQVFLSYSTTRVQPHDQGAAGLEEPLLGPALLKPPRRWSENPLRIQQVVRKVTQSLFLHLEQPLSELFIWPEIVGVLERYGALLDMESVITR